MQNSDIIINIVRFVVLLFIQAAEFNGKFGTIRCQFDQLLEQADIIHLAILCFANRHDFLHTGNGKFAVSGSGWPAGDRTVRRGTGRQRPAPDAHRRAAGALPARVRGRGDGDGRERVGAERRGGGGRPDGG